MRWVVVGSQRDWREIGRHLKSSRTMEKVPNETISTGQRFTVQETIEIPKVVVRENRLRAKLLVSKRSSGRRLFKNHWLLPLAFQC